MKRAAHITQPVSANIMKRAAKVTQPVSANKKARAAPSSPPEPAPMTFRLFEDNGGGHHWTIVAGSGDTLVQSASFPSYEEAKHAARIVHHGASSASFEDRSPDTPTVDLPTPRDAAPARDALDAQHWLDEGDSSSSEAVTR
jgi:uncharacterized protein YegP (UPF0339 family)